MHVIVTLLALTQVETTIARRYNDSDIKKDQLGLSQSIYFDNVDMNLSWSIYQDSKEIEFGIIAPFASESGWLGFGLSMNQGVYTYTRCYYFCFCFCFCFCVCV